MGFIQNFFGAASADNISIEISQNVKELLSVPFSEELWYMANTNVIAFTNWLVGIRNSDNIIEQSSEWIDLLTEEVHEFIANPKLWYEFDGEEIDKLVTLSQVYAYCVKFQYIPIKNNKYHPTKKVNSKNIYDYFEKTWVKVQYNRNTY